MVYSNPNDCSWHREGMGARDCICFVGDIHGVQDRMAAIVSDPNIAAGSPDGADCRFPERDDGVEHPNGDDSAYR